MQSSLDTKIKKYVKPNIFDNEEKKKIDATSYRGSNFENPNKVINNNTSFRIFN